ncbi:MAG: hypothetical protein KAK00_01385 [Nanoarchaeota archaeon]|nr:hypothetical protein [Nanoarchaeota archaeon]
MKKAVLLLILFLFLVQTVIAADQMIINSEDWRDVYSTMLFGSIVGTPASFLVSDRHSTIILNSIPKDKSIRAISSDSAPFVIGYESILSNGGYTATEDIYDNVNLQLASELLDITSFIIVDDSYGYNAISVAPYAVISKSFVLFADRTNIKDIDSFLSGRTVDKLLIYGRVDRVVSDTLARYDPEIIDMEGDRFANNVEIVKKYQEIKGAKQTILTNGEFIEKEIMSGAEPVLFIGANNVPDQVRDYIQQSDIDVGVLIGNELVGTATYIRRQVGISVFVKFAQGARSSSSAVSQVEALDMFYLPVYSLNIELDSIRYNRATNQLEVNLRNIEEQAVYFKGTYSLSASDGSRQTVGDIDPIFLDGNELKTVVYDVEPMVDGKIVADVYIIYGESKISMEKVIDLTIDVETVTILDKCDIDLTSLAYDKRKGIFYIGVKNMGDVDCYVDLEILDLLIDGITTSVGADEVMYFKDGQKKDQKVKVKLSEEDIEENDMVTVRSYYGERENSLIKIKQKEFEMKLKGIDFVFYSLLLVIILLIFLILWKKKKKKEKELS